MNVSLVWLDSDKCVLIALGSTHSGVDCVVYDRACSADRLCGVYTGLLASEAWFSDYGECVLSCIRPRGVHTK